MTELTESGIDVQKKPFKTYRDKIFLRVILTTIGLMLTGWPLALVFAHPVSSLFWNWWYYSFRKVKESSMMPEWYLEEKQVTAEDVDSYSQFSITARRLMALSGIILCLISGYFLTNLGMAVLVGFYGPYYLVRWLIILVAIWRKDVKYPYNKFSDPLARPIIPRIDGGMIDRENPMGLFNPVSPNYVGRSHSSFPPS